MSYRFFAALLVVVLSATLLTGTAAGGITAREALSNGFLKVTILAPSLGANKVDLPATQELYVFLPPSYASSTARYPVVYYFHGYGSNAREIYSFSQTIRLAMESKACKEFIIIGVNGSTKLNGSFWVNSPVSGNWEDFVVKDVVPLIDKEFRTDARPLARGLAGFSMGGFAALNLAFRHSDLFSLPSRSRPALSSMAD